MGEAHWERRRLACSGRRRWQRVVLAAMAVVTREMRSVLAGMTLATREKRSVLAGMTVPTREKRFDLAGMTVSTREKRSDLAAGGVVIRENGAKNKGKVRLSNHLCPAQRLLLRSTLPPPYPCHPGP